MPSRHPAPPRRRPHQGTRAAADIEPSVPPSMPVEVGDQQIELSVDEGRYVQIPPVVVTRVILRLLGLPGSVAVNTVPQPLHRSMTKPLHAPMDCAE